MKAKRGEREEQRQLRVQEEEGTAERGSSRSEREKISKSKKKGV